MSVVRHPIKVVFALVLTLLVGLLPSSVSQAAQDSEVHGLSCVGYLDYVAASPSGYTNSAGAAYGVRCFFELEGDYDEAHVANLFSGVQLEPSFYFSAESSWAWGGTSAAQVTPSTTAHGRVVDPDDNVIAAATDPSLPDNFIEITGTTSYVPSSPRGAYTMAFIRTSTGPDVQLSPVLSGVTEGYWNGQSCDSVFGACSGSTEYTERMPFQQGDSFEDVVPTWPEDLGRGPYDPSSGACGRVEWTWEKDELAWVRADVPAGVGMSWEPGNHVQVFVRYPGSVDDYRPLIDGDAQILNNPINQGYIPGGYVGLQTMRRWQEGGVFQLPDFGTITEYSFDVAPKPKLDLTNMQFLARAIEFWCLAFSETTGWETGYLRYGGIPDEVVPPLSTCEQVRIGRHATLNDDGTANIVITDPAAGSGWATIEQWNDLEEEWVVLYEDFVFPEDRSEWSAYHDLPMYGQTDPAFLKFRCTDATGVHTEGYWEGGEEFGGIVVGGPYIPSCFRASNIGLNPISWVPGLVRMIGCHLSDLFVPDDGVIAARWDETYDNVQGYVPFSWVVNGYGVVSDSFSGMGAQIAATADQCVVWIGDGVAGSSTSDHDRGLCPHELASGGGVLSGWGTIRDLAGVLLWVAAVMALARVVFPGPDTYYLANEHNPGGI